jgi:UMF1 family MFS transporter
MAWFKNNKVRAWCMYDWANSAYVTTVVAAVLPAYFAAAVVPEGGAEVFGTKLTASSLWGYLMSGTALLVFVLAPFLGAVADYSGSARKLLAFFALGGAMLASLLFFSGSGDVVYTMAVFGIAHIFYISANVFYDAFLVHLVPRNQLDDVSGRGFAYGYLGGGIQFGLALLLVSFHSKLGLTQPQAARISMLFAAIWWGGFSLIPILILDDPPAREVGKRESLGRRIKGYARIGFGQVMNTTKQVREIPGLLLFLIAFLLYNDGIQTVISMATIYGKETLGLTTPMLMGTLLLIQFVAVAGSWGFGKLAGRIGPKWALASTLVVWCGVSIYAFFLQTSVQYFIMGVIVGLVLGGSQALSRSIYARLVPSEHSNEFFGYFSVFKRLSTIGGPLVFALITQLTGSSRLAIVSLAIFFISGLVLLTRVKLSD